MSQKHSRARRAAARRAVRSDPTNRNAWCEIAATSFELGDARESLVALDRADALAPADGRGGWLRALSCYAVGDEAAAGRALHAMRDAVLAMPYPGPEFRALRRLLIAHPEDDLSLVASTHALLGETLRYGPFHDRAGAAFERALSIDPAHERAALRRWEHRLVMERDPRDLAELARRAREIEVLAYVAGHCQQRAPDLFEAACLRAIEAAPWDDWGDSACAQIVAWLWTEGRRDEAVKLARRARAQRGTFNVAAGWAGRGLAGADLGPSRRGCERSLHHGSHAITALSPCGDVAPHAGADIVGIAAPRATPSVPAT